MAIRQEILFLPICEQPFSMDLTPIADGAKPKPPSKRSPSTRLVTRKLQKCSFCGHINTRPILGSEQPRCEICKESLVQFKEVEVEIFEDEKLCEGCESILPTNVRECPECHSRYCQYCKVFLGRSKRPYCDGCSDRATRDHVVRKESERTERVKEIGFWITLVVVALIAWKMLLG